MNINHYATKKSVAESMLDVALFMANVTQLKAVLEQGPSFQYYATLIVLISISLFFQVIIGILLIITGKVATKAQYPCRAQQEQGTHHLAATGVEVRNLFPQVIPRVSKQLDEGGGEVCVTAFQSGEWVVFFSCTTALSTTSIPSCWISIVRRETYFGTCCPSCYQPLCAAPADTTF